MPVYLDAAIFSEAGKASLHAEDVPVSFRAARVFLDKKQAEIAHAAGLTLAAVEGLEAGATWAESHK
jgi:hypothetical protein